MGFPRYEKYKDSGVEWLGEVPEHWIIQSFRHCLEDVFNGLTANQIDEALTTVPVTRIETISMGIIDEDRLGFIDHQDAREDRKLLKGDILFSNINSLSMIGNCAIYTGGRDIYAGMNLLVLRSAKNIEPKWLYWMIRSVLFRNTIESLAKPAINQASISQTSIKSISISSPTLFEQKAIAIFLDRETAKIDDLIAEQQKLIELLKEKRQAVISHAVTKGLNPDAKMKDSGIEWLGEVPEHWDLKRLRRVISTPLANGIFKKKEAFGDGTLLINVSDIYQNDFKIKFDNLDRVICDTNEIDNYKVLPGDLFFVRSSLKQEGIAVVAVAGDCIESVVFECHLIQARPNGKILDGLFGSYLLNSIIYRFAMISRSKITTMTTIDQEAILSTILPIPLIEEQLIISVFLDRETSKLDTLISEAKKAITLLQERRTALISATVTGKIDVRGFVTDSESVVAA